MAFHVNYWDYLGWKDVYAAEAYTKRQQTLARINGSKMYTPGFFLNAKEWRKWWGRKVPDASNEKVGILQASRKEADWLVTFQPMSSIHKDYEFNMAVLGFGINSDPNRGENNGRSLRHDFLVLSHQVADAKLNSDYISSSFLKHEIKDDKLNQIAVVFWVNNKYTPEPIQATGGFISRKLL